MRSLKWQSTLAVFMTMCAGLVPAVQAQSGSPSGQGNILLEAIDRAPNDLDMLDRMGELSEDAVYLMSVEEVATPPSSSQIDRAVEANQQAVDDLRSALTERSAVQSVLDRNEISSDQILAVRGNEDLGVIVIYHRP